MTKYCDLGVRFDFSPDERAKAFAHHIALAVGFFMTMDEKDSHRFEAAVHALIPAGAAGDSDLLMRVVKAAAGEAIKYFDEIDDDE